MKDIIKKINAALFAFIVFYLGFIGFRAFSSGYPFSLICYNCKSCDSVCVIGIDPQGFMAASIVDDPDIYVYVTNYRIYAGEAEKLDPDMIIQTHDRKLSISKALRDGTVTRDSEVITYKMKARHAANICIECAACERVCPVKLPILDVVKGLKNKESGAGK
ncbi:MAG TPA: 4Fe-4S dicluster domain-containing protein [Spirochaetota bacterium]|nr:4Fe-4S dicluster domain-containing protein [Spirochaetota bacterium]HPS85854.1 4Fe-4S dicluster domain-containing protein [Spirochaetota bacterium]